MTKKLEDFFGMSDNADDDYSDIDINIEPKTFSPNEKDNDIISYDFSELTGVLKEVDKIDQALGPVKGLEVLDSEMDALSKRAMEVFEILVDIGQNTEDRNVAPVFDAASKMLSGAIAASNSKMDRKLKAIQLQLQKAKLDQEQEKFEWKVKERRNSGDDAEPIEGRVERVSISRSDLIREILDKKQ